ncbi:MAG: T9SS type A sorting domain-containing protein [candidate division Zixibacteria bacterium]|nr:T9SS type A sorting domain-containing protein [candidate division Zixibacteria bacterium]
MKRIGFQHLFLAILIVVFWAPWLSAGTSTRPASTESVTATEPKWYPTLILPRDTSIFLCAPDSVCYDVKGTDVDPDDSLLLTLISGPITYAPKLFPTNSFVEHICFFPKTSGTYRFIWKVKDRYYKTVTDTVTFTIKMNSPPRINDQFFAGTLCGGDTTRVLPVVATDPDHDGLYFALLSGPGSIDGTTGELTYHTTTAGVTHFVVGVFDGCSSDTAIVEDTVSVNLPPPLNTRDTVLYVCDTSAITLNISAHDPEGGPVQIIQSEGPGEFIMLTDTSGKTTFVPARLDSAQYLFVYCLLDDCLGAKAVAARVPICILDTVVVTVHLNRPPTISCPTEKLFSGCSTGPFCWMVDASDPDGDALTLRLLSGNATLDGNQVCVNPQQPGSFDIIIEAVDKCGAADTCVTHVTASPNHAPVVTSAKDFSIALCKPEQVCFQLLVDDIDLNITSVTPNFGTYDRPTNRVCFNADTAGIYTIITTATDSCGAKGLDTTLVTVTMNQPPVVHLGADTSINLCQPEELCLPLLVQDANLKSVFTSIGQIRDNNVCFTPEGSGTFTIIVTATDDCNVVKADTQVVTVNIGHPAVLRCLPEYTYFECPDIPDTNAPFCFSPLDPGDTSPVTLQVLSGNAYVNGRQICVETYQSADLVVRIEATGVCGKPDTCETIVRIRINQPPQVRTAPDFSVFLCRPESVCFAANVDDPDFNVVAIHTSFGAYDKTSNRICFNADTAGLYRIITTATDSCGASAMDTTIVTVTMNQPPVVRLGADTTINLCQPEEVCLPMLVQDANLKSVFTTLGQIRDNKVCFTPEGAGTFTIIVTATDDCNVVRADTQVIKVTIGHPALLTCKPEYDYFVCPTDTTATFCFSPLDPNDTSSVTLRVLTGNAVVNGRQICVSTNQSADFVVRIEATGVCGTPDTCETLVRMRINQPPRVQTASDFNVALCRTESICFEAYVDDPDFNVVDVRANYGTYDKASNRICFNADTAGTYRIILTAKDTCGATAKDTTVVKVGMNKSPIVALGKDSSINQCSPAGVCVSAVVTDDNLKSVSANFGAYDSQKHTVCFTPDTSGRYTIVLTAEDSCGFKAADTAIITVRAGHKPLVKVADTSIYLCYPRELCLPVSISDQDGDIKSITVNRGKYVNGTVCFVPYNAGTYPVIVTVTDSCGSVVSDTGIVTVRTDQSVQLVCPRDTTIFLCKPDTLCFPVGGIPDDATVKVTGTNVKWDPQTKSVCFYSDCCLQNIIKVEVTTACGNVFTCSFTVAVQTNSAPIVAVPRDTSIFACAPGGKICMPVAVNDIDRNVMSITSSFGTYDAYRQILCFYPDTAGVYTAVITAKDSCGLTATATTRIHVKLNTPPGIAIFIPDTLVDPLVCGSGPTEFCVEFSPADLDGNIVSIEALSGTLQPDNRTICMSVTDSGSYRLTMKVTDACGAWDTASYDFYASRRDSVAITCLPGPLANYFCKGDTIKFPLKISGNPDEVISSVGYWHDGCLYLPSDTASETNTFDVTIIARGICNTDTCSVRFVAHLVSAPQIACPGDTTALICGPQTLSFSIKGTGYSSISVNPPAYVEGDKVLLPVSGTESHTLQVIASGSCGSDTCSFTVNTILNTPPVVESRDTTLLLCKLQPVCVPIHVTDIDANITSISTSFGQILTSGGGGVAVDKKFARADIMLGGEEGSILSSPQLSTDTSVQVCFTPDRFGDYRIIVTATDACVAAVDTVVVTINSDGSVAIVCPTVEPATLCKPDSLCVPITISGSGFTVSTSFGKYENGRLCFPVDTGGTYTIHVIGTAACNADTCNLKIPVTLYSPVDVACRGTDTSVFVCKPGQTISIPVTITGPYTLVNVSPQNATIVDGHIILPITAAGPIPVKVVASNSCYRDSCMFTVNAVINQPPVVTVDPLHTFELCDFGKVCFKFHATDPDKNIVELRSSLGIINDSILCFTPEAAGDFPITIKAIDACGDTTVATTTVRIVKIEYPQIACPLDTFRTVASFPDSVRINLEVIPTSANVSVFPGGRYDVSAKQLVVFIPSAGTHTFKVLASTQCGTDSCSVVVKGEQFIPAQVECLASLDTLMCLSNPVTLCLPVTITGTAVSVVVKPVGTYANGQVCLPISTSGTINLQIIASNSQTADTCTTKITVRDGRPPLVQLSDTSIFLCQSESVCLPVTISRTDFGIADIKVTGGRYVGGETPRVCLDAPSNGVYSIIVTAVDSCGHSGADTATVKISINKSPVVTVDSKISRSLCLPAEVCIPVSVVDDNLQSVVTTLGQYNSQTGQVCFNADTSGTYNIAITATDACGAKATGTTSVTVKINRTPVIAGLRDTTVYLCKPQYVCLPVSINDPDGEQLTISTNRGKYENGTICFAPYDSGSYQIIVTATDPCGAQTVDTATVRVHTDQGLVLVCPKDTTIFQCAPQQRCFPIGGIPDGATVRVQGTNVKWDPETKSVCFYSDCCLENRITVYVTTQCGTYSCSFTVKVQTNSAPIVVLPRDTAYVACTFGKICLPVAINDIDKNVASVTAVGGTYDAYRQIVCVTPEGPGVYPIIVTATDTCGLSDVDTTFITLLENHPPVVTFNPTDTLFKQCSPTQICIPVTLSDPDGNIVNVAVEGGTYNSTRGEVCIVPTGPRRYCATLTVTDKCGLTDTKSVCVTILDGDRVDIQCPNPRPTDTLCVAGPVCLPVPVTGTGYTVSTSFGVWSEGQLCFNADTSGLYTIKVIAKAQCNADTCTVTQAVKILDKVDVVCPGNQAIFLCGPDTLCYDLTRSASVIGVVVTAPAYVSGSQICVPVLTAGSKTITVIGLGKCGADTCTFTVNATFNSAPVVKAGKDTTLTECTFKQVCLPFTVTDLNNNVAHVTTSVGTISGNTVCFTPTGYGAVDIIITATDSCGAVGQDTVRVTYNQGLSAKITCPSGQQFASLCKPDSVYVVVPITPSTAKVTILPAGSYNPATGKVAIWVTSAGTKHIKVKAEAQCATDSCEFDLQVTFNEPPKVTCRSAIDTLMCLTRDNQLCFPLTVTGTGVTVTVKPSGTYSAGVVCIPVTAAGKYDTKIVATGVCGADSCVVPITVRANQASTLHLPTDLTIQRCPQDTQTVCVVGFSARDAENPVTLSMVCGIGTYTAARADSGSICFKPTGLGRYEFCFQATDGCTTISDTFAVTFTPKPDCDVCLKVSIDGGSCTPVGLRKQVAINVQSNEAIGGFDLLVGYDASALSFQSATIANTDITGWEYFIWKIGGAGCGAACPSGVVRLVGIADINNGGNHPPDSSLHPNGALVYIEYQIKNDQSLGGQFVPVSFVWYDCSDNSFSNPSGTLLLVDRRIYHAEKTLLWDETDDVHYPESARQMGIGAPDSCLNQGGKTAPVRCIDFINGGVCIIEADSIDARGDVNLNGMSYEIADAVVFTNYFIRGLAAFSVSIPGQIAATDINADGLTLTVSDLALLIRIIVGDAEKVPKLNPYPDQAVVETATSDGLIHVTTETMDNIGAAYFVYDLDPSMQVGRITAGSDASGMDVLSSVENNQLRVLVYNIGKNRIESGTRELLQISMTGSGAVKLSHVELVDYQGRPYAARIGRIGLPDQFVLNQNYPNPFNPSTVIGFSLPQSSSWTLSIYNVTGALVREFTGQSEAGNIEVIWDGRGQSGNQTASGIYLYKLSAGSFTDTKKMILLK